MLLKQTRSPFVRIIGKVTSKNHNQIEIETSDGEIVVCLLNQRLPPLNNLTDYIEVIGKVTGKDNQVEIVDHHRSIIPLGNKLDMHLVNAATIITHHPKVRECFEPVLPTNIHSTS